MTARWQRVLGDQLCDAAHWANIEPGPLVEQAQAVQAAVKSGNPRELDKLLRTLCPAEMWDWPAYFAYADEQEEKATRIRMVAVLANRITRDAHWNERMPQLLENTESHPVWQFRTVADGRDPEECADVAGKTERFDSAFWQSNSPANCDRVYCRCTIRAYRIDETPVNLHGH